MNFTEWQENARHRRMPRVSFGAAARRKTFRLLAALALLASPVLALAALMHGFSLAASLEIRNRNLPAADHNAIKHAYAAAEVYSWLRPLMGAQTAARVVIRLGETNEWAERYVKPQVDWSPETYKDLHNNLAGIEASEWLYAQAGFTSPFTRLRLIGRLAEDKDLAASHEDPRIPPLPMRTDDGTAIRKMQEDEATLRAGLAAALAAKTPALRADLGL